MFDIEAIKDAPKEHCAPFIDVKPQPVEVEEGECAKFLARVSGYPRPKITWRINDSVVVTVSISFIMCLKLFSQRYHKIKAIDDII